MSTRWLTLILLATVLVVVAGCTRPDTPKEVATEFWQALAEGETGEAIDLSTLTDANAFDGFDRDWLGVLPDFGRVVIEADEATVVTRVPVENGEAGERQEVVTYLVQIQDQWFVDYQRTHESVTNPSAFSGLMGEISRLGDKISQAFGRSSGDLSKQMDDMARQFEAYSDAAGQKAEKAMDEFRNSLQDLMENLEQSIEDALKENQQAPKQDRAALQQAVIHIQDGQEQLEQTNFEGFTQTTRSLSEAGAELASVTSDSFEQYQQQWDASMERIRERTKEFFKELTASFNS
ncbi:hypothetical protein [Marinobacter sp. CHS3-4]|uniref:hypothetical protein n=1 Tax=Marinobacter sp. CHS3-4 TaxID=3045174 RepID=UPI0024B4D9A6|nr:hypothetical protein [Marinobacter sp. CHS3-4]MDI9244355.1 hypothetical protein [Marinobacter sp. CHS3-4]